MTTGRIHSFESLGALDGPGLRCVVFFSGCPLRCLYCHNPDTWDLHSGTEMTSEQLMERIVRFQPYFGREGGLTLSGGEPLLQPEFAMEVMERCRDAGISTCVDTAGSVLNPKVKAALSCADLVMLDIKHTDALAYQTLTGGSLETNRSFLDHCREHGIALWIRQVILPGWNDTPQDMYALVHYLKGANIKKIELLPYHTLGVHKWRELGLPYRLDGLSPPSQELMDRLRGALQTARMAQ